MITNAIEIENPLNDNLRMTHSQRSPGAHVRTQRAIPDLPVTASTHSSTRGSGGTSHIPHSPKCGGCGRCGYEHVLSARWGAERVAQVEWGGLAVGARLPQFVGRSRNCRSARRGATRTGCWRRRRDAAAAAARADTGAHHTKRWVMALARLQWPRISKLQSNQPPLLR